jgi:undecaprenyl-diphosphatase
VSNGGLGYGEAALLGFVQGVTEFLPISSKGHLVLVETLLGLHLPGVQVEVALHLGTLLAVALYYARDLGAIAASVPGALRALAARRWPRDAAGRMLAGLAVGTIPVVAAVLVAGDLIEAHFHSVRLVFTGLAATGLVLWTTRRAGAGDEVVTFRRALLVGAAQSVALVPGVSRSGSTIGAGLAAGLSRETAARFSFLLSIPAVLGAIVHTLPDLIGGPGEAAALVATAGTASAAGAPAASPTFLAGPLAVGIVVSFATGLLAIHALLRIARRNRLDVFSWYLWIASAVGFFVTR